MKYVIVKNYKYEAPFIFPSFMSHEVVARQVCRQLHGDVVSAGYISYTKDKVECIGQSTTLKLKSREQDTKIIKNWLTSG